MKNSSNWNKTKFKRRTKSYYKQWREIVKLGKKQKEICCIEFPYIFVSNSLTFLKILNFSTENGRFTAGGAILPPPIGNRVKAFQAIDCVFLQRFGISMYVITIKSSMQNFVILYPKSKWNISCCVIKYKETNKR